ncbi:hypothetical protein RHOER0001_3362 [Rhodococcus erythropolis SK121]|nr:hypothetical protein RHOER0001_3362 [Rhodococcus erythropolis SK121]
MTSAAVKSDAVTESSTGPSRQNRDKLHMVGSLSEVTISTGPMLWRE